MFARGFKSWCEGIALQYRVELSLRPHDPLDAHALAAHLGATVWAVDQIPGLSKETQRILLVEDRESWSAVTIGIGRQKLIITNSSHSDARDSSNLMHELSHLILDHEAAQVIINAAGTILVGTFGKQQEAEATWLAGCLLLPAEAIAFIEARAMPDKDVFQRYCVSPDMLKFRLQRRSVTL